MRNYLYFILFVYYSMGCQGILGTNEEKEFQEYVEYEVTYSETISTEVKGFIKSYSSLTSSTPKNLKKIKLLGTSYTNLVFAVNENNKPVFAAKPNQDNIYEFGPKNTALAVLSTLVFPFTAQLKDAVINEIKTNEFFPELAERIEYLSLRNESFLYDELSDSLINKISTSLTELIQKKSETETQPKFTYNITEKNELIVDLGSKLPFSVSTKYSITQERKLNSVLLGVPLKVAQAIDLQSNNSFDVLSGAYEVAITSNLESIKERISKLTRDILLKTYLILGIDSHNYTLGNGIEELMKSSLPQENNISSYSKSQAFKLVNDILSKESDLVTNYFLSKISEEHISPNNARLFLSFVQRLISNQNEESLIYQYDSFYNEFDGLNDYSSTTDICVENGSIVPCTVTVKEVHYDINGSACFEDEFKIEFGAGYFAPYGLDQGSKLRVEWEFAPKGSAGLWLIGIPDSKLKTTGRTLTTGCFNFGQTESLKLSLSLKDHEGRISNLSSLVIDKPKSKSVNTSLKAASASLRN